jgi:hypothetical protein
MCNNEARTGIDDSGSVQGEQTNGMKTKGEGAVKEQRCQSRTNEFDTTCHDAEGAISNFALSERVEGASTVASEPSEGAEENGNNWK